MLLTNSIQRTTAAVANRKNPLAKIFLKNLQNLTKAACSPAMSTTTINSSDSNVTITNALKQTATTRKEKQQIARKKTGAFVPGTVNLQILGAGANGSPAAVYLFTDQSRYLFNCGEGTQRLAHEHKTKLSRLEQIFLTRNSWSMLGGFPGLALTVQDAGVRELSVHGPPHVDGILHSMKRFVVLKSLQVKTIDCSTVQHFEDAVMTVKSVPLFRQNTTNDNHHEQVVIAYICTLKPRPGALNLEKCVEHGVPPGPLLGLLKNGIDVTLENGKQVKSVDVSERAETALSFVLLDIPSEDFLSALEAQADLFKDLRTNTQQQVALVLHFGETQMLQNNRYQKFLKVNFDADTEHLYLNSKSNNFSGYMASHRIQYQLNQLNANVFPLLKESLELGCSSSQQSISNKLKKTKLIEELELNNDSDEMECKTAAWPALNSMCSFHLRPKKGFDSSLEAKLNPAEYIAETHALPNFTELLKELRMNMSTLPTKNNDNSYPRITFLGTGSCIPNKTRNVSAILLKTQADAYVLLDCGEGTLGQIIRFFGKSKAAQIVQQLKIIYVSHLHADHHIGLIALLNARRQHKNAEKLLLLAPKQIESWLTFYDEHIEGISEAYELIGNAQMLGQPLQMQALRQHTGISSVSTCLVRHCPHSFGVSFMLQNDAEPVKLTYSGDSMPCQDLIELGRNSTILIHEATMEDDLLEEAKIKMHSTISQAIQQGHAMQAKYTVLTHFSQRYAKLPRMQMQLDDDAADATEADVMRNVAIAFDNMQITLEDLQHFHLLYPALKALFAEHAEELEQKAIKRELKLERKRKILNEN